MNSHITDIRVRVLLLTLLMPVLLYAFIFYTLILRSSGVAYFIWWFNLIGILVTPFFNKGRYLSGFSSANGTLEPIYLSPFLKKSVYKISIHSIKAFQITKANYLVSITGGLNIETASGWKCFDLVDKRLGKEIVASIVDMPKPEGFNQA